jgi:hypothetical protein
VLDVALDVVLLELIAVVRGALLALACTISVKVVVTIVVVVVTEPTVDAVEVVVE